MITSRGKAIYEQCMSRSLPSASCSIQKKSSHSASAAQRNQRGNLYNWNLPCNSCPYEQHVCNHKRVAK